MSILMSRVFARAPLVARCSMVRSSAAVAVAARPAAAAVAAPRACMQLHTRAWSQSSGAPSAPAAKVKESTNITGLDVVPNGREVLMGLYKETLASIDAYNKTHGFEPRYNENVRRLTQHRLTICEQEEDFEQIEKRIWFGQIEELIEMAEDELDLLVAMNEEVKPWIPDPEFEAEAAATLGPMFGETREEYEASLRPAAKTDAEKAEEEAFWAPFDAEIAEDQKREAEERAARKK